jgi:hypothetical protein
MFRKYGITKVDQAMYLAILILFVVIAYLFFFNPMLLWKSVQEDAIIEDLTIVALLGCLIVGIVRIAQFAGKKQYASVMTFVVLCLGIIFIMGEELSWGQRIFNIKSSEFFKDFNTQKETNFHNLKINGVKLNILLFTDLGTIVLSVYFLLSRWLCRKFDALYKLREHLNFPLPKVHHTIFFYFSFLMVYAFAYERNDEVFELLLPCIIMLIMLNPYEPQRIKQNA